MKAIILAAGKGKRMRTRTHKVLHKILGKPMLLYVADACAQAGIDDITVVIGRDGEPVREALPDTLRFVTQSEPLGTGHAVMAAQDYIRPDEDVLVLCGDTPLVTAEFLQNLITYQQQRKADAVLTSVNMPDPHGYGRVYADSNHNFIKVVEQADFNEGSDPPTNEVNTGIFVFKGDALLYGLSRLDNQNKQREYYLPDVPVILRDAGRNVMVYRAQEPPSVFAGINTQAQLAEAARFMRERINKRHMDNGVLMMDPATVYIDELVTLAPDVTLYPGVILEGACRIDSGAVIGPNTRMTNTTVGADSTVQYSVLKDAAVGCRTDIGPFAYLRPHAVIGDDCKIGDFVEVKNAVVGNHTKASHLAYIGDADVGSHVNYSCGAITVNYDGKKKHRTVIEDNAFIGCNSNLVAPVRVGQAAFVAAGSTITHDAPEGALAIARERQTNKPGWNKRT